MPFDESLFCKLISGSGAEAGAGAPEDISILSSFTVMLENDISRANKLLATNLRVHCSAVREECCECGELSLCL
jgi:hypothetical protein